MDTGLMVIVPPDLRARATTLNEALAGTAIHVVVDRRREERRCAYQPATAERRRDDRRAAARVVAYVYACPVVAVGPPPSAGTLGDAPASLPSSSPNFQGAGGWFHRAPGERGFDG
jgi:hypothetical protein